MGAEKGSNKPDRLSVSGEEPPEHTSTDTQNMAVSSTTITTTLPPPLTTTTTTTEYSTTTTENSTPRLCLEESAELKSSEAINTTSLSSSSSLAAAAAATSGCSTRQLNLEESAEMKKAEIAASSEAIETTTTLIECSTPQSGLEESAYLKEAQVQASSEAIDRATAAAAAATKQFSTLKSDVEMSAKLKEAEIEASSKDIDTAATTTTTTAAEAITTIIECSKLQSGPEESAELKESGIAASSEVLDIAAAAETEDVTLSDVSSFEKPVFPRRPLSPVIYQSTPPPCRALKRRWYVLTVYCLYTLTQVCVWNTFGPISESCGLVWGWGRSTISLINSLGPVAYVLSGLFFSWLLNTRGLRVACLLSAVLVALGTILRCITMENPAATRLIVTGQLLNGLGGPLSNAGAPKLSASWFPMEERTTATTIGTMALYMGLAVSFVIGPSMVPAVKETAVFNSSAVTFDQSTPSPVSDNVDSDIKMAAKTGEEKGAKAVKKAIQNLMYAEAAWSVSVCLLMACYFPSQPPVPVSASSQVHREPFVQGAKDLFLRHREVSVMALVTALSIGLLSCWSSLLHVNLSHHGVSEKTAGQIGFFATLSAMIFSLSISRLVDRYFALMKYIVMTLFTCGIISFLVFSLSFVNVLTPSYEVFLVTVMVGKTSVESCSPALFELSCELAFPVGEGMTAMLLTFTNNALSLLFLSLFSLPGIGTMWMNWTIVVSLTLTLPLLAKVPRRFGRRALDQRRRLR